VTPGKNQQTGNGRKNKVVGVAGFPSASIVESKIRNGDREPVTGKQGKVGIICNRYISNSIRQQARIPAINNVL